MGTAGNLNHSPKVVPFAPVLPMCFYWFVVFYECLFIIFTISIIIIKKCAISDVCYLVMSVSVNEVVLINEFQFSF